MDYTTVFKKIKREISAQQSTGKVASYIPELLSVAPDKFGMYLYCLDSGAYGFGDDKECFSIQSISKVFGLTLAMSLMGDRLFQRVDVEPSGDAFNSLTLLEYENGIPRNPFINSGALVVSDVLVSYLDHPKEDFLKFIHEITGDDSIQFNEQVFKSEQAHGYRNLALLHLMKSFGNIKNEVDRVLELYISQCALSMSCEQLAKAFVLFANKGKTLAGQQMLSPSHTKRVNAIMQTCGFYDEAGEFSFRVGLPGKSGVGGGIVAVHPGQYSVAVWSPPLNAKGNSELGMFALEKLTSLTESSIF